MGGRWKKQETVKRAKSKKYKLIIQAKLHFCKDEVSLLLKKHETLKEKLYFCPVHFYMFNSEGNPVPRLFISVLINGEEITRS